MVKKFSMAAFAAVFMMVAMGGQASATEYRHGGDHSSHRSSRITRRTTRSHTYHHTTKRVNHTPNYDYHGRYNGYHTSHRMHGSSYYYKPVTHHRPVHNYTCHMKAMDSNNMSVHYSNGEHVPVGTNVWLGAYANYDSDSYDWYVKHNGHWVKQSVHGHEWDYTVWEHGTFEFKVVPKYGSHNCSCYFSVHAY